MSEWGHGNSGNILFAHSVYKSLFRPDNRLDVNRYNPDFASPDEINEKYDAFVLPLANAFRPSFESQLERYTSVVCRLKIPCIVVGVGAQAGLDLAELKGSTLDDTVRAFVAAVLDRSATIGVRGEFTRDYLNRLGFRAVDVIGCPSMCYNGAELNVRKSEDALDAQARVAVNHTPFTGKAVEEFVRRTLGTFANGVFVAQADADAGFWAESLAAPGRVARFFNVAPWIAFLRSRRFCVGTRIHGNIAAILAGVPAFVVAHDSRTLELARFHEIPHALVSALAPKTTATELYAPIDAERVNAGARARFEIYKSFLARNGLAHGLDDPRNAALFEARSAALEFPADAGLP